MDASIHKETFFHGGPVGSLWRKAWKWARNLHGVQKCVKKQALNKTVESVWEGGKEGLIHRVVGEVFFVKKSVAYCKKAAMLSGVMNNNFFANQLVKAKATKALFVILGFREIHDELYADLKETDGNGNFAWGEVCLPVSVLVAV